MILRSTPSKKYSSRSNAGEVITAVGVRDSTTWKGNGQTCSIQLYDEEYRLSASFKYMFQKLVEKAHGNYFLGTNPELNC